MNRNESIQEEVLRELYLIQMLSGDAIAQKIGASSAAVYNALVRFGIPLRHRGQAAQLRWSHTHEVDWEVMANKYDEGHTLEDIAAEVGCSLSTASAHLSEYTTVRPRGSESPLHPNSRGKIQVDLKRAIELNQGGATLTEISAKLPNHPSVQVLSKRFQDAGQPVLVHKASKDKFKNLQVKKRVVAHAIKADRCQICPETRGVQLCHIQARRKGGPLNPDNAIPLCPSHHWFFDQGFLTKSELSKVRSTLLMAKRKGYIHHVYCV